MPPATTPAVIGQNASAPCAPSDSGARSSVPGLLTASRWLKAAWPECWPSHRAASAAATPPPSRPSTAGTPCLRTANTHPSSPHATPPSAQSAANQPSAAMNALVSGFTTSAPPPPVVTTCACGATAVQRKPASRPASALPATRTVNTTTAVRTDRLALAPLAAATGPPPGREESGRAGKGISPVSAILRRRLRHLAHRGAARPGPAIGHRRPPLRNASTAARRRLTGRPSLLGWWTAIWGRRTGRDYRRGRQMIEAHDLTKRYGDKLAVDHLSFTVGPGTVTGFLGPNGAGKSTTMRLVLGLDRPDEGTATINGRRYRDLAEPLRTVGALLEARSVHTGRSAYNHLLFLAQSQGLPRGRVDEVLQLVGLQEVARKRAGGFSLGMSQRLGIAAAMLGDPRVLLLDEPVNGLDPEGVLWIRNLIKQLAAEGRTVFVSSHLMNEMAVTADHLIVIGRGRLIAASSTQEFIERSSERSVLVRSPDATRLAELINADGGKAVPGQPGQDGADELRVTGMAAPRIGELAASAAIVLHELTPQLAS